jgi:hypothetical protein
MSGFAMKQFCPWPFVFGVCLILGAHPGMKLRSLADKKILVLV